MDEVTEECKASDAEWDQTVCVLANDYQEILIKKKGAKMETPELAAALNLTMKDVVTCLRDDAALEESVPFLQAVQAASDPSACTSEELSTSLTKLAELKSSYRGVLALLVWPSGEKIIAEAQKVVNSAAENTAIESNLQTSMSEMSTVLMSLQEAIGITKANTEPDSTKLPLLGSFCETITEKLKDGNSTWNRSSKGLRTMLKPSFQKSWEKMEQVFDKVANPCTAAILTFHTDVLQKALEEVAVGEEEQVSADNLTKYLSQLTTLQDSFAWITQLVNALGAWAFLSVSVLEIVLPDKIVDLYWCAQFVHHSANGSVTITRGELEKKQGKDELKCADIFMNGAKSLAEALGLAHAVKEERSHLVTILQGCVLACEEHKDNVETLLKDYTKMCKEKFESELVRSLLKADERDDIWPDTLTSSDIVTRALALPKPKTLDLAVKVAELADDTTHVQTVQLWGKIDHLQRALLKYNDLIGTLPAVVSMEAKEITFEDAAMKALTEVYQSVRSYIASALAMQGDKAGKTKEKTDQANKLLEKAAMTLNRFVVVMCLANLVLQSVCI